MSDDRAEQLLTIKDVSKLTSLSQRKIYALMSENNAFPKPIKIGGRRNAWLLSEVWGWINDKAEER